MTKKYLSILPPSTIRADVTQNIATSPSPGVSGNAKNLAVMVYNILNGDSLAYSFPDAKIEG